MSKYIIHALFVQRSCRYEGEYAPELYDAVDEFTNDENPEHLLQRIEEAKGDSSIDSFAVVEITVDAEPIDKALSVRRVSVNGVINEDKP